MKYLITATLLLIAFSGLSQSATKKDSVCFSIETAAKIMADIDRLEICIRETNNLNTVVVPALKESVLILKADLKAAINQNQTLTNDLNDCQANERSLKRKRIWWGIGGVVIGAVTYAYLSK